MLRATAVMLTLAVSVGCLSNQPRTSREDEVKLALDLSRRFFDLGEMERAQGQAQKGLKLDPDHIDLRLTLGRILQHRGSSNTIAKAEEIFRGLIDDADEDWRLPLGLAEVLERKGLLYSESADDIKSGVRYTDASDPDARAAELEQISQDSWIESLTHFETSLAIREGEAPINGMQRVNSLLERYEESLRWSERMLELIAIRKRSWRDQLAVSEISAEDERRFRTRLHEDDAKEARTRLLASSNLRKLSRLEDAIEHLDMVIELEPDLIQAFSRRAMLHFELEDYQRAVDSIDHFLRAMAGRDYDDPDVRQAYNLRDDALNAIARREGS
ncbi:MAG: tetratricopeptide (TPR) repeat protein [Planctomycetota bacterium]|jgi:tetratricopeptide (TPR) repeat protein